MGEFRHLRSDVVVIALVLTDILGIGYSVLSGELFDGLIELLECPNIRLGGSGVSTVVPRGDCDESLEPYEIAFGNGLAIGNLYIYGLGERNPILNLSLDDGLSD